MKLTVAVLIGLVTIAGNLVGQTKVIDIWQGKVPGAIERPNYTLIDDSSGGWTFMRNITNPLLDMYAAPKELATGTAVIVCPGGGYWGLAYKHEGADIAKWFNKQGITAFVLKYRLPDSTVMSDKTIAPLQDAQEAIRIVRRNAVKWNINPNKIGVMGFSAGGHLASSLSTHYSEVVYKVADTTSARPNFSILIYPVITMDKEITHMGSRNLLLGQQPSDDLVAHFSNETMVDSQTPPAFLIHSLDDGLVPVQNSINYVLSLRKYEVPCELHLYESGGHGYGMGNSSNSESNWPEACQFWLKRRGF